ncbi:MAG TPA: S-adenosylmethionine:tRNA ribosyltransferase-isomerase [Anaerolineales bacterium]|jgi:S-adenosylmethionine:tRNA ribosyltransferase-isomerase|nr:S-adenosylmethionine:tRNA ribosyltransferase-isomerase [Anaerolineales bacterium]
MNTPLSKIEFSLPPALEASAPPEARGLRRDQVRLMVSNYSTDHVEHTRFYQFHKFLNEGDVLVINTSRTRNSALLATRADGTILELHLSIHFDNDLWTVEVRSMDEAGKTKHFEDVHPGENLRLPGESTVVLQEPYVSDCNDNLRPSETLWLAKIQFPKDVDEYLASYGFPIRYNYVKERWPLSFYQTVYATESGSAEMPSAGRPFTWRLLKRLETKGVRVAPLILHTGVSNLETHEPPYKEYYRVTTETAQIVNKARASGKRIVAVGTTAIRALETVTNGDRITHAGEGWTCLVVTPQRGLRAVNALLTGMHEPEASHLAILEGLAGLSHIKVAYDEALRKGYLWHEFGDLHLILP